MRPLAYLLIAVLIAANVSHCAAVRNTGNQIRTARARRLAEAEGE